MLFLASAAYFLASVVASETAECSDAQDHRAKLGASLIQTRGTITNINTRTLDADNPDIDAVDRDYLSDANNPLDAYYANQWNSDASDVKSTITPSVPSSQASPKVQQRLPERRVFPSSMDAWERDLVMNGDGAKNGESAQQAPSSFDWAGIRTQRSSAVCVTREDPQAKHFAYTTAPAGTPCVFGVDARDEGSHCIMGDGEYGSFGWCFTSTERDAFGSCSSSCPLFGSAKLLGDKIDSLDAKVRAHQAWERWFATSMTSTTTTAAIVSSTATTTTTAAATTSAAPSTPTAEPAIASTSGETVTTSNSSASGTTDAATASARSTANVSHSSAGSENATARNTTTTTTIKTTTTKTPATTKMTTTTKKAVTAGKTTTTTQELMTTTKKPTTTADKGPPTAKTTATTEKTITTKKPTAEEKKTDGEASNQAHSSAADQTVDGDLAKTEGDGDAFAAANALSADTKAEGALTEKDGDAFAKANALSADT